MELLVVLLSVLAGLRSGGLKSLAASGSLRVISGETTVREVMEAVGPSFWSELAAHYGAYYSAEQAESIPMNAARGFGVLLVTRDPALAERLRPAFVEEGLRLVEARTRALTSYANPAHIALPTGDWPTAPRRSRYRLSRN